MNSRIKKLRKALDLTQQEFANRIGSVQNTITGYETGRRIPSNQVISLICKTFNVSETWLRTGEGEMFSPKASAAMEALARERGLTHSDFVLIEKFLNLKPESRVAIAEYMLEVAAALNSDDIPLESVTTAKKADIASEVSAYHSDLLADKKREEKIEAERFGETAKALAMEQYFSEKKPDAPASSANGSAAV